ncbi:MAG TPA: glycosyltransferase family A protein, partial [Planctomycetota bacterium]|nr:glycosyltransferase family A protein [Planctomycetota bacterium]
MPALDVSVVIPTYNRASLVPRAVESALAAVRPGDEVIVVDDGSTDGTVAALARFGDRIRLVAAPHQGAGPTRNRGVREARGALVAFLDSDDAWLPDHLELHRAVHAARPDIALSFSDFQVKGRDGAIRPRFLVKWHGDARPWDEILGAGVAFSSGGA